MINDQGEIKKVNIPNDLSNIQVSGDTADRAKQVKLKLNKNRVHEIYEYLKNNNEFYKM